MAKKWILLLAILIIGLGFFLRAYNFSSWLHFEIDQSYDTLIVSHAVENGIGNLPLLGPTAGGGRALRLGPAFYYLEYLSAEIFGNTPPGHAAAVLIFSILTLPLFYFFCRRYFSAIVSLGLLAIASFSLYLILYGRFSWSPNVLPFFILLSFYALLRSASPAENKKGVWLFVFAAIGAITTQIHFNAFFILPPVAILFLLFTRPKINWKYWLGSVLIILVVYSPLILSEIKTKGQDTAYFFTKIHEQSQGSTDWLEKLTKNIDYSASEYFLIDTGIDNINFEKIKDLKDFVANPFLSGVAILLLALEIIVLISNLAREKDNEKKDFLILLAIWFFISFAYFFSIIGRDMFPRFFLLTAPLAILLLGLLLEKIRPEKNKLLLSLFLAVLTIIIISNVIRVNQYFHQLALVQAESLPVQTKDVFPNTARLTFQQETEITKYIAQESRKNNYPVYLKASHEYGPALWYLLEGKEIEFPGKNKNDLYADYDRGNYFVIAYSFENVPNSQNFTILETKNFGILKVYKVIPNDAGAAKTIRSDQTAMDISLQKIQVDDLYTWDTLSATKRINPANYPDYESFPDNN